MAWLLTLVLIGQSVAPFERTTEYFRSLVSRLQASSPELMTYTFSVKILDNQGAPSASIIVGGPLAGEIRLNDSYLRLGLTEEEHLAVLAHEMSHTHIRKKMRTASILDRRSEELLVDQLAYETLIRAKVDPIHLVNALEKIKRSLRVEDLRINWQKFPLGAIPIEIDSGLFAAEQDLVRGSRFTSHPTDDLRAQMILFRRVRDDVRDLLPRQTMTAAPEIISRELEKSQNQVVDARVSHRILQARAAPSLKERVLQMRDLFFEVQKDWIEVLEGVNTQELQKMRSEYVFIAAEIAQMMRLFSLTHSNSKKLSATDKTELQTLMKLFDVFHVFSRRELSKSRLKRSSDSFQMKFDHLYLFQESLAVAGEFREALTPANENLEEQYSFWVDQMLQPESINKDFWRPSSRFTLLGALLSGRAKKLLKPEDFEFLISEEGPESQKELPLEISYLLFPYEHGITAEDYFHPRVRSFLEGYNLLDQAVNGGGQEVSGLRLRPRETESEFLLRVGGSPEIGENPEPRGFDLPDLKETPNLKAYTLKHERGSSQRLPEDLSLQRLLNLKGIRSNSANKLFSLYRLLHRLDLLFSFGKRLEIFNLRNKPEEALLIHLGLEANQENLPLIKDPSSEELARIRGLARRLSKTEGADFDQYFAVASFFSQIEIANSREDYLEFLSSPAGRLLTTFRQELLSFYLVDPFVEEVERIEQISGIDRDQIESGVESLQSEQLNPRDKLRVVFSQYENGSFHSDLPGADAFLILDLIDSLSESSWSQEKVGHRRVKLDPDEGSRVDFNDELSIFLLEARKRRLASQSLASITSPALQQLEDFSLLFETHLRHLFKSIELESPSSLFNLKIQALQARIHQDIGPELGSDLMAKTALVTQLSRLSSKNEWMEKQLVALLSEIRQESNLQKKNQAVQYLMKAIKLRYVRLDVRGVEEWANYLIQDARQRILQAEDAKQRASLISEVADSLRESLRDSPFFYVIDPKIDELLIQIKANREESRVLSSVKSFEGSGEATDAFTATPSQVDRINHSTWAMDAIALTMIKRTAAENELLRRFVVLGEGLEGPEAQAMQKLLIQQILDHYVAQLHQLESVLGAVNVKLTHQAARKTQGARDELISHRDRPAVLLESELKALYERFKRLPPAQQIVISASLMSLPGEDSSVLESKAFNERAVSEFLMEDDSKAGPLRLLAQEFLSAFSPEQRALLLARSEIENQGVQPDSSDDLKRLRARRFSALGSALQPFGDKLIQILARNQAIDPVYREVFKIKEDRASTPSYETLYQMLEPHLLPEEAKQLDRISAVKAGSVKITLIVDFKDDQGRIRKKVFSIRRPSIERSVDIVYEKTRQALRQAAQQKGGEILKPFMSVPDDAYALVKAEMKFEDEFQRTQEALEQYRKAGAGAVSPSRVQSVLPERFSQVGRDQQAIVFPYHEGIRLDQIPDDSLSRDLTEEILKTEIDFLLADEDEIRFDADRHQGNILITSGESGFEAVHIDFGQWVSVSRQSRDFFARLIFAYLQDGLKRDGNFDQLLSVLSQSADQSASDFAASEFWKSLQNDLRELQKRSPAEMTEAQRAGELITALLYVKEALVSVAPESEEQKRLTDDLFRLTKSLETLGGLSSRFEGLFASVFMDRVQSKLGPEKAFELFVDPAKVISGFFSQPAQIQCEQVLSRAAEVLKPRLREAQ